MKKSAAIKIAAIFLLGVGYLLWRGDREPDPPPESESRRAGSSKLDAALTPATPPVAERDGLAAAILIDVSGSMNQKAGKDGATKIDTARRAALNLVEQFARYADDHKTEPVMLGLYEFSGTGGARDVREVLAMGAPDRARAAEAIAKMEAGGGTPIGDAMIAGKKALDGTGLSRRHLLVVTDGENTDGSKPEDVAAAIARRPVAERPSIYLVAFDIAAGRFDGVRNAGGLVLEATNARTLTETLDALLRGKIFIER